MFLLIDNDLYNGKYINQIHSKKITNDSFTYEINSNVKNKFKIITRQVDLTDNILFTKNDLDEVLHENLQSIKANNSGIKDINEFEEEIVDCLCFNHVNNYENTPNYMLLIELFKDYADYYSINRNPLENLKRNLEMYYFYLFNDFKKVKVIADEFNCSNDLVHYIIKKCITKTYFSIVKNNNKYKVFEELFNSGYSTCKFKNRLKLIIRNEN